MRLSSRGRPILEKELIDIGTDKRNKDVVKLFYWNDLVAFIHIFVSKNQQIEYKVRRVNSEITTNDWDNDYQVLYDNFEDAWYSVFHALPDFLTDEVIRS